MHRSEFQENIQFSKRLLFDCNMLGISDFYAIFFPFHFLGSKSDCLSVSYDYIDYLIYNATYIGNVCLKLTCNKQITSHIKVEIC